MVSLSNERGIALITAMLLALISLIIVLAALYVITQQTQLSGANKRYQNALEATHGGAEVFTKNILPVLFQDYSGAGKLVTDFTTASINLDIPVAVRNCLNDKLRKGTADWTYCSAASRNYDPKDSYDTKFNLKGLSGQPGFNIYTKIVDTQMGNSDMSGLVGRLETGVGVTGGGSGSTGGVSPQHIPALYRIEVQGERDKNPLEKAALTVMYAY